MLPPVACITCGMSIGEYAELYDVMMENKNRERMAELGTTPNRVQLDSRIQLDSEDILNALRIPSSCCRIHLTTTAKIGTYYYGNG
jgi:DNA-directed RNA polymerase subunit N (RpoN/RPB10)